MKPRARAIRLAGAVLVAVAVAGACGKKGPPQPPLRPVPARIADLTARLGDGAVTLAFTVPAANTDGTTPAAVERIEIYRDVALRPPDPAAAGDPVAPPPSPPPAAPPLVSPQNLVGTLPVLPPPIEGAPAPGAVVPGAAVTWRDPAPLPAVSDPADAPTWRYVVLPVVGRDRSPGASNLVQVPLGATSPEPADVRVSYDERNWLVQWTPAGEATTYQVLDVPPGGGDPVRLTPTAIAAPPFTTPVEFGRERCFAVQPVVVREGVTIEAAASAPVCDTPSDTFPPPAPAGLVALQEGAVVVLRWSAVTASDLGGYLVLRGEGQGATLTPLVATPQAGTTYRDEAVRPGVTYIYAVVAVDRATPPNVSAESNRETVVVRDGRDGS